MKRPRFLAPLAPSLEEQIFTSPVIVRASLQAAAAAVETVPSTPGVAPISPGAGAALHGARIPQGDGAGGAGGGGARHPYLPDRGRGARGRGLCGGAARHRLGRPAGGALPANAGAAVHPGATSGGAAGAAGSACAIEFTRSNFQGARVGLQRGHVEPLGRGRPAGRRARGRRTAPARCSSPTGRNPAAGGVHDGPAGQDRGAGRRAAGWG